MKQGLRLISLLIAVLLLASCGMDNPKPTAQIPSIDGYPVGYVTPTLPKISIDTSYPAPATSTPVKATPTLLKIPTSSANLSNVTGILMTPNEKGQPFIAPLILGRAVPANKPGFPPMISYSDDMKMTAIQDATGKFLFSNIAPGQYALLIANPLSAVIILDQNTNTPFLFDVAAGETKDLGIVSVP